MFFIDADRLDYTAINEALRRSGPVCRITGCLGQRFIAAGMSDKTIEIYGIPGNALGAYLTGAEITVNGNAQDAVGDTMNAGRIVVRGDIGDTAGYAIPYNINPIGAMEKKNIVYDMTTNQATITDIA